MDDSTAKELVSRMNRKVNRPDSGKLQLPIDDVQGGLRQLTAKIIRLADEGNKKLWGPNLRDLNALSKLILTDDQYINMNTKKAEVAKDIFDALPPEQGGIPVSNPPVEKRARDDDEEDFLET